MPFGGRSGVFVSRDRARGPIARARAVFRSTHFLPGQKEKQSQESVWTERRRARAIGPRAMYVLRKKA